MSSSRRGIHIIHPALETDSPFTTQSLQNLSPKDQALFKEFGMGPRASLPFALVHQAIEEQVRRQPESLAAIHEGFSLSYAELGRQAEFLADLLFSQGVRKGDRVGLFSQRSLSLVVGIFACLKLGAVYVPQDARITPSSQLSHIIQQTGIQWVLTLSHLLNAIPAHDELKVLALDVLLKPGNQSKKPQKISKRNPEPISDQDLCFLLFTSGTTGLPNGVQVTHRNLCNILLTSPGNLGMKPGLVVSQILNIAFDMAAWEILGSLSQGATLWIRGKSIQEAAEKADVVIATPSILGRLDADRCRHVQVVALAGEPCPQPLADRWSEFATVYNCCGPTEVTIVNTMQAYDPVKGILSIGKPTPNNTVYILDENLKPCAIGEVGEMWAGGDCVTTGYWDNDLLNQDRYRPDPFLGQGKKMFRTRDLGRWNSQGELEHWGRTDDQVKIRGFRVELDSVSKALEATPNCQQAVTLKWDNENLVSFVRPASVNITAARKSVTSRLPYYCSPAVIVAMDEFPATSRGKIDKRALLEQAKSRMGVDDKRVDL